MRSIVTTLSALLILGSAGIASAQNGKAPVATLEKLEGTVMVNKGKGYITHKTAVPLNEGDSVVTLKESAAEIVFADGCRAQLKANNMMAISLTPGCKAPIVAVNPPGPAPLAAGAGTNWAGPVLAGAAGIALIAAAGGSDDDPISGE